MSGPDLGTLREYVRCPQCEAVNHSSMGLDCWDCHADLTDEFAARSFDDSLDFEFVDCVMCHELMLLGAEACPHCGTPYALEYWDGEPSSYPGYVTYLASLAEDLLPYDAVTVCCDQLIQDCTCTNAETLDYRRLAEVPVDAYDPSSRCVQCWAYQTSACTPLRIFTYMYYVDDVTPAPLSECAEFMTHDEHDQARLLAQVEGGRAHAAE